jgi:putative thioredoxin
MICFRRPWQKEKKICGIPSMTEANGSAAPDGLVKETSTTAFRQDVLAESLKQPVLVDFWAPWCGPCKELRPLLEKVVKAAKGKVKLVTMDIEAHPQVAGQLGIQSIPAVIAFTKGQPIDGFMGALPESQIRGFIERLVGPLGKGGIETLLEATQEQEKAGDLAGAAGVFSEILAQEPENIAAIAGLVRIHVGLDAFEEARRFLALAPEKASNDPLLSAAKAALDLAEQAASLGDTAELEKRLAANPRDHQARFDLALALNGRGKREEAAEQLLDIIRRDRTWNEDGARLQLVQFFEAWGPMDDATIAARRRLSSLLFA